MSWTPDGKVLLTSNEGGNNDLWIIEPDGSQRKQLTDDEAFEGYANGTPDGRYIVYETNRRVGWSIWRMNTDGSNQTELQGNLGNSYPQVTADSRWIVYSMNSNTLWKSPVEGGKPKKIATDRILRHRVSPNGKQVAYLTRGAEINAPLQIKVISIDGGEPTMIVNPSTSESGFEWSPDGNSFDFIRTNENVSNLVRSKIKSGETKNLTDMKVGKISSFRWSPDGKQIALATGESDSDLVLIGNFR